MSLIRKTGKFLGQATGLVLGEPIKYLGEKTGVDLIKDIGDGVVKSSEFAGDTVGQIADGAWDTAAGLVDKDDTQRNKGLGEMGEALGRTARGVVQTAKGAYHNGKQIYEGISEGDDDRWKAGAAGLVKIAAVGTIAVGVADFVGGADVAEAADETTADSTETSTTTQTIPSDAVYVDTINEDLAGTVHPETGVPYELKTVEMPDGETIQGVFPDFESDYTGEIPEDLYLESDYQQFNYMNNELAAAVEADPQLASQFTDEQLEQIATGETPDGYVWHHTEVPGELELVNEETHAKSAHTGGRSLWGGGTEYR